MKSPAFKISLSIIPPFSTRDVEVCHIERLVFSTKFDLVFVFKNFKKQFYKVKDVSLTSLTGVKDQLSSLDIKYTEGIPHNWPKIRKTISRDPEKFYDSGGWSFLESNTPDDLQPGGDEDGGEGGDGGSGEASGSGGGGGEGVGAPRRKKLKKETVVAEDNTTVIISSSGEA